MTLANLVDWRSLHKPYWAQKLTDHSSNKPSASVCSLSYARRSMQFCDWTDQAWGIIKETLMRICMQMTVTCGNLFAFDLPSVGSRWSRCTGSQPASDFLSRPGVCHIFSPGLRSPSQPTNVANLWPVPSYTAWWQKHIGVTTCPRLLRSFISVVIELTTYWSQV